jgi:hypothetical protein
LLKPPAETGNRFAILLLFINAPAFTRLRRKNMLAGRSYGLATRPVMQGYPQGRTLAPTYTKRV